MPMTMTGQVVRILCPHGQGIGRLTSLGVSRCGCAIHEFGCSTAMELPIPEEEKPKGRFAPKVKAISFARPQRAFGG